MKELIVIIVLLGLATFTLLEKSKNETPKNTVYTDCITTCYRWVDKDNLEECLESCNFYIEKEN